MDSLPSIPSPATRFDAIRDAIRNAVGDAIGPTDAPLVTLHIGPDASLVMSAEPGEAPALHPLHIGADVSARQLLRHTPPGRAEFEQAIEVLEDEIIRIHRALPRPATLATDSPMLREIARLAGIPESDRMLLGLGAMEDVFSRLSAVIQGQPAHVAQIPEDNAFAIRLTLLRELMHHLHFETLVVVRTGLPDLPA